MASSHKATTLPPTARYIPTTLDNQERSPIEPPGPRNREADLVLPLPGTSSSLGGDRTDAVLKNQPNSEPTTETETETQTPLPIPTATAVRNKEQPEEEEQQQQPEEPEQDREERKRESVVDATVMSDTETEDSSDTYKDDCVDDHGENQTANEVAAMDTSETKPQDDLSATDVIPEGTQKFVRAPGAPIRFKSGFMFFSTQKHKEIRSSLRRQNRFHEKTTDIAKFISRMWKNLPPEEKEKYLEMGRLDKQRYTEEKARYVGPWKVLVKPKPRRKPKQAPRRGDVTEAAHTDTARMDTIQRTSDAAAVVLEGVTKPRASSSSAPPKIPAVVSSQHMAPNGSVPTDLGSFTGLPNVGQLQDIQTLPSGTAQELLYSLMVSSASVLSGQMGEQGTSMSVGGGDGGGFGIDSILRASLHPSTLMKDSAALQQQQYHQQQELMQRHQQQVEQLRLQQLQVQQQLQQRHQQQLQQLQVQQQQQHQHRQQLQQLQQQEQQQQQQQPRQSLTHIQYQPQKLRTRSNRTGLLAKARTNQVHRPQQDPPGKLAEPDQESIDKCDDGSTKSDPNTRSPSISLVEETHRHNAEMEDDANDKIEAISILDDSSREVVEEPLNNTNGRSLPVKNKNDSNVRTTLG